MLRIGIWVSVDTYGSNAKTLAGPDDAASNFTSIGDEDLRGGENEWRMDD